MAEASVSESVPTTPQTPRKLIAKRPRGTPTLQTPHCPQKRASLREINAGSPRRLAFRVQKTWSEAELKGLVEFVLFHCRRWPTHKQKTFWENAGEFAKRRSSCGCLRSGERVVYTTCTCTFRLCMIGRHEKWCQSEWRREFLISEDLPPEHSLHSPPILAFI